MKFSGFLLGSVFGAASALHCDEHNFLQWSCYTVSDEPSEPTTLSGLATKFHVNPQRLADLYDLGKAEAARNGGMQAQYKALLLERDRLTAAFATAAPQAEA